MNKVDYAALIDIEKAIMKLGTLLYDNLQTEYLDKYHSFITENSLTVKITREGKRECKIERKTDGTTTIPSMLMD